MSGYRLLDSGLTTISLSQHQSNINTTVQQFCKTYGMKTVSHLVLERSIALDVWVMVSISWPAEYVWCLMVVSEQTHS